MSPAARRAPARKPRAKAAEPIVFRGPPDRLASLLPAMGAPEGAEATLKGAEVRTLAVRPTEGDAHKATLKISKTTPPGTYKGTAVIEGKEVPIVAEVEGKARLDAHPRRVAQHPCRGGAHRDA